MYVINLETKVLINQLKTLSYCIGDYIYLYITKERFVIGDLDSLCYCYHQYNKANFDETLGFKVSSDSLLKIKGIKSPKGQSFLFIDEETNTGGIYLEANNLSFELILEPYEYKEYVSNLNLIISSYDLTQISALSKCYKDVYLTDKYLIGFDSITCGFSQLSAPLGQNNFSLILDIKTTLINNLVKLTDLFFCSFTDNGLVLSDDIDNPSFVFQTGRPCELTEFQQLIIDYLDRDKGKEIVIGKGIDLCNIVGTAKSLSEDKLIYFGTKGEVGYTVGTEISNLTKLEITLDYPIYLNCAVLEKVLSCFKKSNQVSFIYIDSYHPVFITDERKLHYEAIIPYRVIMADNENTRD